MEQFFPGCRRELIERVAGSVGKGAAESQYLLKLCAGVQAELIACRRPCCRAPGSVRGGGKTLVARSFPNRNLRAAVRPFVAGRTSFCCRSRRPHYVRHNRCSQSQGRNSEKTSSRGLVCRKRLLQVSLLASSCGFEFPGYYRPRRAIRQPGGKRP
jgi:hypothetical protein